MEGDFDRKKDKEPRPARRMYSTEPWERELLHLLMKDSMTLRKVMARLRPEMMSDDRRMFFMQQIVESFRNSHSLVNKEVILYELDKTFIVTEDRKKRNVYESELDIISAMEPTVTADLLLEKIEEADRATKLAAVLESAWVTLEKGNIEEAICTLKRQAIGVDSKKDDFRVVDVDRDSDDWIDEIIKRKNSPESYIGIPTGFAAFDKKTGGLFAAELTIVFGLSGKGKSTVLKAMCNNMRESGYNILHVANEENEFQVRTKYQSVGSNMEYFKFKRGKISDEEIENWKKFNANRKSKRGSIFIVEIPQQTDVTLIERAFYILKEKGIDINLICIDYMDLMAPTRKAFNENDEQAKVSADCKQLAVDCNVPVLTATQAATTSAKQETKDVPFLTTQDVYGTKRKSHAANTLIGIVNVTATQGVIERKEGEILTHTVWFCVPKQRDGECFIFKQILYPTVGRFEDAQVDDADKNTTDCKLAQTLADESSKEEIDKKNAPVINAVTGHTDKAAGMANHHMNQIQKMIKDADETKQIPATVPTTVTVSSDGAISSATLNKMSSASQILANLRKKKF